MKIVHFSDTHLGFSDLDVTNAEGINQREADFYDAFAAAVDRILEIRPDFILHTGDLFHRSSPSNRAIAFALSQIKRIDESGIPMVLIAGNHSTPRTVQSEPILRIFDTFGGINAVYRQQYEKVAFDRVVFHAIPHIHDERRIEKALVACEEAIDPRKKNIMMLHCSVGAHYLMQEFGEWVYPREWEPLFAKMDYVALGHWHGAAEVPGYPHVWYSGSLERTSGADRRNRKGFLLVDLQEEARVDFVQIPIRPVRVFEIDCLRFEENLEALECDDCDGAMVEVRLIHLSPLQSIDIPNTLIEAKFPTAMSIQIRREFLQNELTGAAERIESLSLEAAFIEHLREEAEAESYERLAQKTRALFARVEEGGDGTH